VQLAQLRSDLTSAVYALSSVHVRHLFGGPQFA